MASSPLSGRTRVSLVVAGLSFAAIMGGSAATASASTPGNSFISTGGFSAVRHHRTTTTVGVVPTTAPAPPTTAPVTTTTAPATTTTTVHPTTTTTAPAPTTTTTPKPTTTTTVAPPTTFTDGFSAMPLGAVLQPGTASGAWMPQWNGYGQIVRVNAPGATLELSPATATSSSQTHSALVTSVTSFADTTLTMNVQTVAQLRQGSSPNPWEVGWVLWHFTDSSHFYYLALKPNGWELGKEDPAYTGSQRFLATGSASFAVGSVHSVRIVQVGNSITVSADGIPLTTFVDNERPYLSGTVGLYCEDSQADYSNVSATGKI